MRERGTGSIETVQRGGVTLYRPRLPGHGGRLMLCETYEEADGLLRAARHELTDGDAVAPSGLTVESWGLEVLDLRERQGRAATETDRSRWRTHVERTPLGSTPLSLLTRADVVEWRDHLVTKRAAPGNGYKRKPRETIGRSTAQNALNLLRVVLGAAVDREIISANPAQDVKLPPAVSRPEEPWTYLLPDEQAALVKAAREFVQKTRRKDAETADELAALIIFAIHTGLRQGEQWNLRLTDVDMARGLVTVRRGSKTRGTKGKRVRRVPLLPPALTALEEWLPVLRRRANDHALLFPAPRGGTRQAMKPPRAWSAILKAAKLDDGAKRHDGQEVRWHDLRHTCASSLVAGWWGRAWSLQEVRDMLGHRSITTTERYAHLAPSVVEQAAKATPGRPTKAHDEARNEMRDDAQGSETTGRPRCDSNTRSFGLGTQRKIVELLGAAACPGTTVGRSATEALVALAAGEPGAWEKAVRVVAAVAMGGTVGTEAHPAAVVTS